MERENKESFVVLVKNIFGRFSHPIMFRSIITYLIYNYQFTFNLIRGGDANDLIEHFIKGEPRYVLPIIICINTGFSLLFPIFKRITNSLIERVDRVAYNLFQRELDNKKIEALSGIDLIKVVLGKSKKRLSYWAKMKPLLSQAAITRLNVNGVFSITIKFQASASGQQNSVQLENLLKDVQGLSNSGNLDNLLANEVQKGIETLEKR